MNYQILIDKERGLDSSYIPPNLIEINSKYKPSIKLEQETYHNWLQLKEEVLNKGYNIDIESGYRSYEYQATVLRELIALKGEDYASMAVAQPGHSEHQTGLAIDYCIIRNSNIVIENDIDKCEECIFTNSIAHQYGFIVRYPDGKQAITGYKYEPWHLRYVGMALATYLYVNKITLDEYYKEEHDAKN
ncbi:MAG: M15 family metallopeptidase [Bacilli bacterium]|jgi:D-alanyl-D-alanine carboxypeptidase